MNSRHFKRIDGPIWRTGAPGQWKSVENQKLIIENLLIWISNLDA